MSASARRWATRTVGGVAGVAIVAACGGGGSSSPSAARTTLTSSARPTVTTAATATSTTAPLGSGPSTATLSITGDKGVTGSLASSAITCSMPGVDGSTITVAANTAAPGVGVFMFVGHDGVRVRVTSGSGATFRERDFTGHGVTGFDAARGAHLDATLHETGTASGASAALPAASALTGDIDCGGQRPGSSTIVVTGDTSRGAIDGRLDPVHVSCTSTSKGRFVTAVGIVALGGTPTVVFVDGQPTGLQLYVEPAGAAPLVFTGASPTAVTTTAHGMHVDGDATEKSGASSLHVSGDAVCGTPGG